MGDEEIRTALSRHWAASAAGDYEREHEIYQEDAALDYPQSGERIRGRRNIQASRAEHPAKRRFEVRRVFGSGETWVTEYILTYDDRPYNTISVMEFSDGKVILSELPLRQLRLFIQNLVRMRETHIADSAC